eukprot:NODE_2397_length_1430_cov_27.716144_g2280_i0.p1 GENE.NODE_2397_length_1430_cov_27.716144_g2280_i0~~NODE_2397_length_1430_cov_27.716144_g2280_i0.p1  ORF type:complete len:403 (+),score=71.61 NODE_2397_length_1430_cov_27.716144_g2280_i0:61-1209(+)
MDAEFLRRLRQLLTDGAGFKGLCDWMVSHPTHASAMVNVWCEQVSYAEPSQADLLFRLLNIVVKHREGKPFLPHFRSVITDTFEKALRMISTTEQLNKLQEMVQLWHSKDIFGPVLGDRLQKCLTTRKKVARLREMFPSHDASTLESTLHHCNSNLDVAIEKMVSRDNRPSDMMSESAASSCPSWADLVDEDIPEFEPERLTSPSSSSSHFNQFAPRDIGSTSTPRSCTSISSGGSRRRISQPLNAPSLSMMTKRPAVDNYTRSLEVRVQELENTVAKQSEELAAATATHKKLDEFIRELRVECAKLIQRNMNAERGHAPIQSAPTREARDDRRRQQGNRGGYLNPSASPFQPPLPTRQIFEVDDDEHTAASSSTASCPSLT